MRYHSVSVIDVIRETHNAVTICFDPKQTPEDFLQFIPGQQISIKLIINNKEFRRSYSICSALHENIIKVTVKKLAKGIVSGYLVDHLKSGDLLEISKPEGHFCIEPSADKRREYFFIAAGSGITPVFSMIKSLLENEPKSILHLLYGNRTEKDIIFHNEIEALKTKYEGQFNVHYTLTKHKTGFLPFLSSSKDTWDGWKGRIDQNMLKRFIDLHPQNSHVSTGYYICGPGNLIESTKTNLIKLNIDSKQIHAEYFTTPANASHPSQNISASEVTLIAHLNDRRFEFKMPGNKKILDFLVEKGLDPPYSCSSGACSTCMAKIIQGEVKMDVALALEPEEIEQGYILTCQSRPASTVIEIKY